MAEIQASGPYQAPGEPGATAPPPPPLPLLLAAPGSPAVTVGPPAAAGAAGAGAGAEVGAGMAGGVCDEGAGVPVLLLGPPALEAAAAAASPTAPAVVTVGNEAGWPGSGTQPVACAATASSSTTATATAAAGASSSCSRPRTKAVSVLSKVVAALITAAAPPGQPLPQATPATPAPATAARPGACRWWLGPPHPPPGPALPRPGLSSARARTQRRRCRRCCRCYSCCSGRSRPRGAVSGSFCVSLSASPCRLSCSGAPKQEGPARLGSSRSRGLASPGPCPCPCLCWSRERSTLCSPLLLSAPRPQHHRLWRRRRQRRRECCGSKRC